MIQYLRLELVVMGPVLSKGAEPGDPGLDAVALRAPDGSLVINGKHLHGRCRHAAFELGKKANRPELKKWATGVFGPPAPEDETKRGDGNWKPDRSRISFEELRCGALIGCHSAARDFRLMRNEDTEAGEDRMLGVFERAGKHGERLRFSCLVRIVCNSEETARRDAENLLRALRWLTNIGGIAGSGYGVLQSASLKPCKAPQGFVAALSAGPIPDSIAVDLELSEPLCLAAPHLDENIFHCLDYVPGAAIAGAIQRTRGELNEGLPSERFSMLQKHFDKIRFRHGFPVNSKKEERPIPAPYSWACITPGTDKAVKLIDVACIGQASMLEVDGKEYIPRFSFDWKPDSEDLKSDDYVVTKASGWGQVTKELRTFTAIDPKTGAAMDKKLYSYEMARPEGMTWRAVMDLGGVPAEDSAALLEDLKTLLTESPLLLGKTDARAIVALNDRTIETCPDPIEIDSNTDRWIVTLIAQALLLDIMHLAGAGESKLNKAYSDAWNELGSGMLTLEHYFTNEELVGSNYLHHRFCGAEKPYSPYLITGAGSVFVLKSDPAQRTKVKTILNKWLKSGLPLRQWAINGFSLGKDPSKYWANCPFAPQNGFGEIVVNHQVQMNLLHEKPGVKEISVTNGGAQ